MWIKLNKQFMIHRYLYSYINTASNLIATYICKHNNYGFGWTYHCKTIIININSFHMKKRSLISYKDIYYICG